MQRWLFVSLFCAVASSTFGRLVERYIDDTFGDSVTQAQVVYRPSTNAWQHSTCAESECLFHPDVAQAHNGTWIAGIWSPGDVPLSLDISFTGVAVEAYFILPPAPWNTSLYGVIDGEIRRWDSGSPTSDYQYNQLVFAADDLENKEHKLTIYVDDYVMRYISDQKSALLFDYVKYFADDGIPEIAVPRQPRTE